MCGTAPLELTDRTYDSSGVSGAHGRSCCPVNGLKPLWFKSSLSVAGNRSLRVVAGKRARRVVRSQQNAEAAAPLLAAELCSMATSLK